MSPPKDSALPSTQAIIGPSPKAASRLIRASLRSLRTTRSHTDPTLLAFTLPSPWAPITVRP